jgi:hypothetical protein
MTSPQAEPSPQALGESLAALAVQVAALRSQIVQINQRLDQAGLRGDLDLFARFEELARLSPAPWTLLRPAAPPRPTGSVWTGRPSAPSWASCGGGLIPCCASTTLPTSCRTAGPATSRRSGNCPLSPPHGTTSTATSAPTWYVPWSSTTAGFSERCDASPPSPARAYRNAPCAAAPGDARHRLGPDGRTGLDRRHHVMPEYLQRNQHLRTATRGRLQVLVFSSGRTSSARKRIPLS